MRRMSIEEEGLCLLLLGHTSTCIESRSSYDVPARRTNVSVIDHKMRRGSIVVWDESITHAQHTLPYPEA